MFTISDYRKDRRDFPVFSLLEKMAADKAVTGDK
jgi:hypothetical protein